MIKGTSKGIHTDTDGKFTLTIPNTGKVVVLSISYVGMKTREIGITTQKTIKIKLESDTEIGEVVVTGYGVVQRREDLVGSAYQVSSKKLELMPVSRVDNLLDGMVPGMQVSKGFNNSDESMRARLTVRIRGDASLSASNEPLWVVDGAPIYTGGITGLSIGTEYTISPLSFMNPNDIESITVLKDASTTALYGADGANGVILITTKKGRMEKTNINVSFKYGIAFANESTRYKMLNASQYMEYAQEAWVNAGYPISAFPYQDSEYNSYSTTDTRWHELYLDTGQTFQVDLSASGGTKRMKNYISAGYYTEDMILKGNKQQRISLRSNSTYTFFKGLEATVILNGTYNINDVSIDAQLLRNSAYLLAVRERRAYLSVVQLLQPGFVLRIQTDAGEIPCQRPARTGSERQPATGAERQRERFAQMGTHQGPFGYHTVRKQLYRDLRSVVLCPHQPVGILRQRTVRYFTAERRLQPELGKHQPHQFRPRIRKTSHRSRGRYRVQA